jgi:hypothetical protein
MLPALSGTITGEFISQEMLMYVLMGERFKFLWLLRKHSKLQYPISEKGGDGAKGMNGAPEMPAIVN